MFHLAKNREIIIALLLGLLFIVFAVLPILSFAQPAAIVPCDGPPDCDYNALIELINRLLNFLIYFAGIVAVIMFVWAGSKLLLSGGNPSAKEEAKTIIKNTVIGFLFVLAAWLIVQAILAAVGVQVKTPIDP